MFFSVLYLLFCSCKTSQQPGTAVQNAPVSANPGSCTVEGRILQVLKPANNDSGSVCFKYPCRAVVLINSVSACGSSVSYSLTSGDTVTIKFAYTLVNTEKAFPLMKAHFPGLKKGESFMANVEHRMAVSTSGEFIVYDYEPR
jgi:hypothetical protein